MLRQVPHSVISVRKRADELSMRG